MPSSAKKKKKPPEHPTKHVKAAKPRGAPDTRDSGIPRNRISCGDCEEVLKSVPEACVDLIFTSPPYADARKHTYGGIAADKYVEWFLPKAAQFQRVLKPTGTFVLNIKERVVAGERHTYVLELILALRGQGWLWTEEYIWHKKNCYPGKWPNRFRDAWERCLQFNKQRDFYMNQDAVMVPMGDWAERRLRNLSKTDRLRDPSRVGSGFGKNVSNWLGRDRAYPTNVLHHATETANRGHSATFPRALPEFFIKAFCPDDGLVLDPFMGSGTTLIVAKTEERGYLGIDFDERHTEIAEQGLQGD